MVRFSRLESGAVRHHEQELELKVEINGCAKKARGKKPKTTYIVKSPMWRAWAVQDGDFHAQAPGPSELLWLRIDPVSAAATERAAAQSCSPSTPLTSQHLEKTSSEMDAHPQGR